MALHGGSRVGVIGCVAILACAGLVRAVVQQSRPIAFIAMRCRDRRGPAFG